MHDSNSRRRKLRDALIPFTLISLFTLLISLALSAPALADPPGRIGRVAWLSAPGGLTLDNGTRGESFQPAINQPLTSGDVLRTDANTRAEIQIGSTTLRLDEGTSLELTRIDDERVNLFLARTNVRMRALSSHASCGSASAATVVEVRRQATPEAWWVTASWVASRSSSVL